MIKNQRQYRITRAQARSLARALARFKEPSARSGISPLLKKAEREALQSQLADLRAELRAYERVRGGKSRVIRIESIQEVPRLLIRARIAADLTQKELAERLGLKEQQIQRYEATEYASASLGRVLEVARALALPSAGQT